MNKMTNKQALDNAIEMLSASIDFLADSGNYDTVNIQNTIEKIEMMRDAASKKAASKKPTAKQQKNECIKQQILDVLRDAVEPMKCGDIGAAVGISGNQTSALLSQLVKAGAVERDKGAKGVSVFSLHAAQ